MNTTNINIIDYSTFRPTHWQSQLVWYTLIITLLLLLVRLFLQLFQLHTDPGLLSFFYNLTGYTVSPISSLLQTASISLANESWVTLISMVVYFFLALGLSKLLKIGQPSISEIEYARAVSRKRYGY